MMFLFLKDSFPKINAPKVNTKKMTGSIIASMVVGYIIALMIKTIRGTSTSFLSLYIIIVAITFATIEVLLKRKEKREKK